MLSLDNARAAFAPHVVWVATVAAIAAPARAGCARRPGRARRGEELQWVGAHVTADSSLPPILPVLDSRIQFVKKCFVEVVEHFGPLVPVVDVTVQFEQS